MSENKERMKENVTLKVLHGKKRRFAVLSIYL